MRWRGLQGGYKHGTRVSWASANTAETVSIRRSGVVNDLARRRCWAGPLSAVAAAASSHPEMGVLRLLGVCEYRRDRQYSQIGCGERPGETAVLGGAPISGGGGCQLAPRDGRPASPGRLRIPQRPSVFADRVW